MSLATTRERLRADFAQSREHEAWAIRLRLPRIVAAEIGFQAEIASAVARSWERERALAAMSDAEVIAAAIAFAERR